MKKILFSMIAIMLMVAILLGSNVNGHEVFAEEKISGLSSAKSYIMIDSNGRILFENNSEEKVEVASICKLMTTLITLENIESGNISLDDKFVASDYACMAEGSQAFLDTGCEYSVRDLLKSVIVASANDSAIVLAENIAGNESNFVNQMNKKASEIGMKNTLYANSTGLHDKNEQYSTAKDTAIILNKISDFDVYKEDSKIWIDKLVHPSGRETELVNTNRLIRYYPYTLTGKTGFTDEAGYCLSSTALKDDLKLTCVVLGCDSSADRFSDSVALYNYAYSNFMSDKIIDKNIIPDKVVAVDRAKENFVELEYENDFYLTRRRSGDKHYELKYNLPERIIAPVYHGDIVGSLEVMVDGEVVGSVNILAVNNIEKQTLKDIIGKIVDRFSIIK